MPDQWTDRLSEYLDGELTSAEWMAMERHLRECAECASTLAELRRVTQRARALPDRPPATDLWPAIAARIGTTAPSAAIPVERRRRPGRWSFSLPQLAAAGIALVVFSAGGTWLATSALRDDGGPGVPPEVASPLSQILPRAVGSYQAAVTDLQQVIAQDRGRLDSATVRVLEENLRAIDAAIAEAERAAAADPANVYLSAHLVRTMQRKLALLRRAAAIASAIT